MKMRVIVATDGKEAATGAVNVALTLAERAEAVVEVISVLEPVPTQGASTTDTIAFAPPELEAAMLRILRDRVEDQIAAAGAELSAWPLTVEVGLPAPTIVRFARAKGANLIILGLGRHAVADRWFGTETALRVMRLAHVPVLAVPAEARTLPRRAVAAVDFTEFSRDAAEAALRMLPAEGTLHVAHVFWRPSEEIPWVGGRDWVEVQRERMQQQLDQLTQQLARISDRTVLAHFLEGDATSEIRHLAEAVGADLIAAGSHGTSFFSRLLMGSVSTRLVRGANGMVLIAPPRTVPRELEAGLPEVADESLEKTGTPAARAIVRSPATAHSAVAAYVPPHTAILPRR